MRRQNKYFAKKTYLMGKVFASKEESRRYAELMLLVRAGEINDLQCQVPFEIIPAQREAHTVGARGGIKKGKVIERAVKYVADFTYKDRDGNLIVEDTKGYKEGQAYELFVIKRKLMLYVHGIRVKEV